MKKIMIPITMKLPHAYPIVIGKNMSGNLEQVIDLEKYSSVCIITDPIIKNILKNLPENKMSAKTKVIVIPSGEQAKNITTVERIWEKLLQNNADRKSLVINIGGGVITDMGGFAASTFMRGIDFINIPTTLLAQVDASVGGKTGINFEGIKNSIGTFNQPIAVIIDVQFLQTLPKREFLSGFAEVIKHGIIADKKYFDFVTSKKPTEFTESELVAVIEGSCRIKSNIITHDVTEKGERKLINFGHTIGHAIEALSLETNHPLLHGEAISIGMVAETMIAVEKGLTQEKDLIIITNALSTTGLPTKITGIKIDDILKKILHDKKIEKGIVQWTLITKIGKGIINQHVDTSTVIDALRRVIV